MNPTNNPLPILQSFAQHYSCEISDSPLVVLAKSTLSILESNQDWSADTAHAICSVAHTLGLAHDDEEGFSRVGHKPVSSHDSHLIEFARTLDRNLAHAKPKDLPQLFDSAFRFNIKTMSSHDTLRCVWFYYQVWDGETRLPDWWPTLETNGEPIPLKLILEEILKNR